MVPVTTLWLPIVVSAVLVFFASFILHMVLPLHRNDWRKLPAEDDVMAALGKFALAPGDYAMPCGGAGAINDPAFKAKMNRGPVAFVTVLPAGPFSMGSNLAQWFVFNLVVSVFAAYVTGAALPRGAEYLEVFRFAGTTAFTAYVLGFVPQSIWYKRAWSTQLKNALDGLVYALLTAGVFGWLWPQ
jgi:hypothetical protein